tara:strand:+ start:63691 stop:64452 length:762 start_codon:yes stop_codon:yes gene_type:complete
MRYKIIAGNWKMNTTPKEGVDLVTEVLELIKSTDLTGTKIVFGTPFVSLLAVAESVGNTPGVYVASQNISSYDGGAYTGETSANMISACGAKMAIIGHSERREYFHETNAILATKADKAIGSDLTPIYCCGEVLADRKNDSYQTVIQSQIEEGLFHLSAEDFANVVIAYEPVWAIGTGETASPEQAQAVHAFIRNLVKSKYGAEIAENVSILYGGSMKPTNAKELIGMPDIDGGLIGGASLKAADFVGIINAI